MLNSITWAQYFAVVIFLLICYYIFIGFRFYRWEILSLIGIKKIEEKGVSVSTVAEFKKSFESRSHEDYLPKPALELDISPLMQAFTDEVRAYLQESDSNIAKGDLLQSIQMIVAKHPALNNPEYKQELLQFIFDESNAKYPNLLQQNDVIQLLS